MHQRTAKKFLLGVACIVLVLIIGGHTIARFRSALYSDPFYRSPRATTFPTPKIVQWTGSVQRIFLSGEGLEIRSTMAPGGVFHAYMPDHRISPFTDGVVGVTGQWVGISCEYGQRCVPDVRIETIVRPGSDLQ